MKNTANKIINWQHKHKKNIILATVFAFLFVLALNIWNNSPQTIKATPLLFLAVFFCLCYAVRPKLNEGFVPFAVLGAVFGFFTVANPLVYSVDGISKQWTLLAVPVFLFFSAVICFSLSGLSCFLQSVSLKTVQKIPQPKNIFFIYFASLLLPWLVVFLSFGPLRISADSYNIIQQAIGVYPITDSHPVLYTLILRLFLAFGQFFGSITAGAYMFGFFQLCFWAGVLSFSLFWLLRQGAPALYVVVALLYFAICPVFAINAITAWKDIPFNALLLLLSIFLYCIANTGGAVLQTKKGMAKFLFLCFAVCFMRGNGFYIVLLCMLGICFLCRGQWQRWLVFFVPFLLLVQFVQGPIYTALGISRLGGVERAALPLQQVARAVKNGAPLNQNQNEIINKIIPVEDLKSAYVSASPDYIKSHPNFNRAAFNENFAEFMGLWLQLFKTNKQVYLDAWLLQTLGYWKLDFKGWAALTSEFELSTGIVQKDVWQDVFGIDSRGYLSTRTGFFSLSLMAYIALFCSAHFVARRRAHNLLFLLPMLALWLGMMLAAPAYAEFRYMLLYPLCLPVLLFLAVDG